MIIVMQIDATDEHVKGVCEAIREHGLEPLVMPGEDRVAIGIPAALDSGKSSAIEDALNGLPGINKISQTSRPYKLASLEFHRKSTVVTAGDATFGAGKFTVIAGPCSIESHEQLAQSARAVKDAGASVLRGGAYKPRTSPYSFQGLGEEGLKIMRDVGEETGLATITEVMSVELVETVARYVDILQIGARSMQNFPLLIEAGRAGKPVFLKRGPSATIDDFLLASEYILSQGNDQVILCERGIVGFDRGYTRNTLDLAAVPVLKEYTHLPVVVDPSHGTGKAGYVAAMAKAALVAGADGLMVEVHPDPQHALSDGAQSLNPEQFGSMMNQLRKLAEVTGVAMA